MTQPFTADEAARFDADLARVLARFPPDQRRAALLPALHLVQQRQGYVSDEAMAFVAERLGLAPSEVKDAATFYTMFHLRPVGRHHFQVCRTLSCWLRGQPRITRRLEERLGIRTGEVSKDGRCSITEVECLGSCGTAPMLQLNDDYHENLDEAAVDRLVANLT